MIHHLNKAAREKAAKEKAAKEKTENIAKAKKAAKAKLKMIHHLNKAAKEKAAREKAAKTKKARKSWNKIKGNVLSDRLFKTKHNTHSGLWDKIKATFVKCDVTKGHTTLNQDRFEKYTNFLIVDSITGTNSLFDLLTRQHTNIKIDDLVGYLEILWTKYKGDLNRMERYGDDPQVLMVQMTRAVIRMVE